jgi:hypothetical protein
MLSDLMVVRNRMPTTRPPFTIHMGGLNRAVLLEAAGM